MAVFSLLVVVLLLTACIPTGLDLPQSPLLASLERKSGLIAYVGLDGNIYTIDQGGGQQTAITSDANLEADEQGLVRFYQHPAWSRDDKYLAFVGVEGTSTEVNAMRLLTATPKGEDTFELFRSSDVIPFYLSWSPNNEQLGFLATTASGIDQSLFLVPTRGGDTLAIGSGTPLFWAWSPDNSSIVVHSGGAVSSRPDAKISLHPVGRAEYGTDLGMRPSSFQAPTYSPDGDEMLLAVETEGEPLETLVLADDRGMLKREITEVKGPVAFGWSPDGGKIAFISNAGERVPGMGDTLMLVDPEHPEAAKRVSDEIVIAFFWSPDGEKLAYFTPTIVQMSEEDPSQQGLGFSVGVYSVSGDKVQDIGVFLPTQQFISILYFFDQYQHSFSLWSPDSRNLLLSTQGENGDPALFVVEASGNLEPRFLADGFLGVWSW
jgi:TolB protein